MLSAIIRGRTTSCCSPVILASAAPDLCNAVSDWVGSCVITIKRRRVRAPNAQSCTLTPPRRSGDREAAEDLWNPLSQLTRPVSLPTRYDLPVRPPLEFFDRTDPGQAYCTSLALPEWACRTADRSIRRCVDHIIVSGEMHLRRERQCCGAMPWPT